MQYASSRVPRDGHLSAGCELQVQEDVKHLQDQRTRLQKTARNAATKAEVGSRPEQCSNAAPQVYTCMGNRTLSDVG